MACGSFLCGSFLCGSFLCGSFLCGSGGLAAMGTLHCDGRGTIAARPPLPQGPPPGHTGSLLPQGGVRPEGLDSTGVAAQCAQSMAGVNHANRPPRSTAMWHPHGLYRHTASRHDPRDFRGSAADCGSGGLWERRTVGAADCGSGGLWERRTVGAADCGSGGLAAMGTLHCDGRGTIAARPPLPQRPPPGHTGSLLPQGPPPQPCQRSANTSHSASGLPAMSLGDSRGEPCSGHSTPTVGSFQARLRSYSGA
ncbi:hypothetical protein BSY238_402 [Methyloversatilis sp. RAC08]|nr:hypothetical protein BSY238_402 [Methyloversatilis sp. RAC08]